MTAKKGHRAYFKATEAGIDALSAILDAKRYLSAGDLDAAKHAVFNAGQHLSHAQALTREANASVTKLLSVNA